MAKPKNFKVLAVCVGTAVVVGAGVFFLQQYRMNDLEANYSEIIAQKDSVIQLYTQQTSRGYIANREIEAGETLKITDFSEADLPNILSPENLISDPNQLVGKIIKLGLKPKTPLTVNMVYDPEELTNDLRKYEYDFVRLPLLIEKTDILEMQIVFPNGVKQTIIPKFKLTALDKINNVLFLNASFEHDALVNAAFVDMVLWGGEVRAIQYVDGETQMSPRITYTPNEAVLALVKNSPQVVEEARARYNSVSNDNIRKTLETELAKYWTEGDATRFNVNKPDGSYVATQFGSGIGTIIITNPDATGTPTESTDGTTEAPPTPTVDFNNSSSPETPVQTQTPPPVETPEVPNDGVVDEAPQSPDNSQSSVGIGE